MESLAGPALTGATVVGLEVGRVDGSQVTHAPLGGSEELHVEADSH